VAKLNGLGIDAAAEDIITSTQSALLYLRERPDLKRIYVFGTESLTEEVRAAGLEPVTSQADAVLLGFPTTMVYEDLCGASFELERGAVFLATHPDPACPSPRGLLPDAGSFMRCLTETTGREADLVFGKPSEWMLHLALERAGLERHQMAVVGDRLMTDIRMGASHGMPTVLVLSGATSRDDLSTSDVEPDLVVPNVGVLADLLRQLPGE
jgi:HAD superfamily hydrolase (TIGR01450 family)